MRFINDPTTEADDEALLIAAKSSGYILPLLVSLGMVCGTAMALVGKNETVKTIGGGVVTTAVAGLIGVMRGDRHEGIVPPGFEYTRKRPELPPAQATLMVSPAPPEPPPVPDIGLHSERPTQPIARPTVEPEGRPNPEQKMGFRVDGSTDQVTAIAKEIATMVPSNIEQLRAKILLDNVFRYESDDPPTHV
jgi:hypothetical protein